MTGGLGSSIPRVTHDKFLMIPVRSLTKKNGHLLSVYCLSNLKRFVSSPDLYFFSSRKQAVHQGLRNTTCSREVRLSRLNTTILPAAAGAATVVSSFNASSPIRLAAIPTPKTKFSRLAVSS